MSPEQAAGANVDGRSDIFALGIVLHELLTGRRLFKADSDVQTLARVRECQVAPPSSLNPELPSGLDSIVLKALAKDPDERYGTAQEFRLALEDWLVQGRMSASSAHLAEFLKLIYAERLEKQARLGPLMGDPGFSGPAPGMQTTANATAATPVSREMRTPARAGASVNNRNPAPGLSSPDASVLSTESGAPWFISNNKFRWSAGLIVVAMAAASIVSLAPGSKRAAPPEPTPAELTLKVEPTAVVPQREAPRAYTVAIAIEPVGTEIFEGSRLIGKSPKVWSGAPAGEHELTFRHDGYHEEQGKIAVARDGDEFSFKPLRKIEMRKSAPELGIKAER
jgi:hypothetical protein